MKNLLLTFWLLSTAAFGLSREQLNRVQTTLEARISPIVRTFDPNAFVFVKLKTQRHESRVAILPFLLEGVTVPRASVVEIEKIEIVLLSEKAEIPKAVIELLKEIASDMGVRVGIKLRPLPTELTKTFQSSEQGKPSVPVAPETLSRRIVRGLSHPSAVPMAIFFTSTLILFSLIAMFWYLRLGTEELSTGLEQVAHAIETGMGNHSRDAEVLPALPVKTALGSLRDEGLLALLSDCYWCKFDSYAAYIWSQVPIEKRHAFLDAAAFVREYVLWLGEVQGTDLGVSQELYYQAPLRIDHLDNTVLSILVKENPGMLYQLPSLRRGSLDFNLKEKVEITRRAFVEPALELPDFGGLPPSLLRTLSRRLPIALNDVKDEAEILNLKNPTTDLIGSLPTLGWWTKLPDEDLVECLKTYTARELASAWIGPDFVLDKFEKALPKHKAFMVKAYLRRVVPNRSSSTFKALCQGAVSRLQAKERSRRFIPKLIQGSGHDTAQKKAA